MCFRMSIFSYSAELFSDYVPFWFPGYEVNKIKFIIIIYLLAVAMAVSSPTS
jgi:hypothetical protein